MAAEASGTAVSTAPLERKQVLFVVNVQDYRQWQLQVLVDVVQQLYANDTSGTLDLRVIALNTPLRSVRESVTDINSYLSKNEVSLVLASNPTVLRDLLRYAPVLHTGKIPILFYEGNTALPELKTEQRNVAGVFRKCALEDTISDAFRALPDAKKVLLLLDRSIPTEMVEAFLEPYRKARGVEFVLLSDRTANAQTLQTALRELPKDSFVVAMQWFPRQDKKYASFSSLIAFIRQSYEGPIFSTLDVDMSGKVVGGYMGQRALYARAIVDTAFKILDAGSAYNISDVHVNPVRIYDANELERFGIPRARINDDAIILNAKPSLWEQYSLKITIAVVGVVVLLSVLGTALVYLLTSRFWREKNTEYLRRNNAIFGALPSSISVFDANGTLLFYRANALYPKKGEHPLHEPIDLSGFFSPKVMACILALGSEVLATGKQRRLEHVAVGHWYESTLMPAPQTLFSQPAVICSTTCIDELKHIQHDLDASVGRLHATLHAIGDGVVSVDARGIVNIFNPVAQALTGIDDATAVMGCHFDEIFHFCDHISGVPAPSPLLDALSPSAGHHSILWLDLMGRNGARIPLSITVGPLHTAQSELRGAVFVLRSMSQELAIQEEMEEKNALLLYGAKIARVNFFRGALNARDSLENLGGDDIWPRKDGRPIEPSAFILPEDFPAFRDAWRAFRQSTATEFHFEFRSEYSGTRRYYQIRALHFSAKPNALPTYFGVIQDLTQTRKNEQGYHDVQLLLSSIMDGLPTYIFAKDVAADFRYAFCNSEFARMLGRRPDQIIGKFDKDLFENPRDIELFQTSDRSVATTGNQREDKEHFLSANGIWRTVMVMRKIVECADGRRLLLGMGIDISRQEKVESELRRRDEESRRILDNVASSVLLLDAQLNVLHANPTACEIAAVSPSALMKNRCSQTICKTLAASQCPAMMALKDGKTHSVITPRMSDGRIYSFVAKPLKDAQGNISGVVETGQDITDLLEATDKAAAALKKARKAAQARSAFLATMSHEIRTPLNAVIGFSELLQEKDTTQEQRAEFSQAINMAGRALLRIINDILDLSKIESAKMEINLLPTRVDELLDEIHRIFSLSAAQKQLEFSVEKPVHSPVLLLDDIRLRQVLFNIVGNAVKFTARGFVRVSCAVVQRQGQLASLRIDVADSGMGISEDFQQHIFEPFSQQFTRGTRAYQGSGLGMSIAKRLIEQMGGKLSLESKENEGSIFTVMMPSVQIGEDVATAQAPAVSPVYTPIARLKTGKVLVVDDVPMNCIVLKSLLTKLGIHSHCVHSMAAALNALREESFLLVLTDLWMPEDTGEDLARALRGDPLTRDIPVWAVTADTESSDKFDTTLFNGIILKPVTLATLSQGLRAAGF